MNRKHNSPLNGAAPGSPRRGGDKGKLFFLVLFVACLFSLQSCIPKLSRFLLWNDDDGESSGNLLVERSLPFHPDESRRAPNMTKLFNKTESIEGNKSQPVVTVKKPATDETLSATKDSGLPKTHDPDIALVAVLSMQRSSSTSLTEMAMTINGTNPCVLSLQEVFSRSQSRNDMELYGQGLLQGEVYAVPPRLFRDFIMRVAKKKCTDQLKRLDTNNVCHNRCIVGFKEFEEQISYEQHEWLWKNIPNMTIVVLERDVEARWNSRYVAEFKDDWNTKGFDGHKQAIKETHVPSMSVSDTDEFCESVKWNQLCRFGEKHNKWYSFIRDKLSHNERVEVSFEAAILNGGSYARGLIAHALPFDFQDLLVPPAERIVDPQLAFVAVVSMQRSSSTTLTSKILSTNKTNPCVISLNEIFINSFPQSGDAWPVDGRHLQNKPKRELKPVILRDFLVRVAKRRCIEQLTSQDTNNTSARIVALSPTSSFTNISIKNTTNSCGPTFPT